MLPQSPTGPMEDHDLMALEFTAQTFLVAAHIPSYADWFANCDMEPTYRYEKRVLKLLQWKTPEKRWRLKSPTHTMFLDAYEKVFPEARFVQTHRDVSKRASVGVGPLLLDAPRREPRDRPASTSARSTWISGASPSTGASRSGPTRRTTRSSSTWASRNSRPIRSPEIGKLYEWLGDELTAETVERMLAWRADNPEGQVRQARVRRRELRDHRRCVAPTFRALPEPVRIVPRVTCT